MKHTTVILMFVFLAAFTQCIVNIDDNRQHVINEIIRINIPEREHGYYNFSTTVISTSDSLRKFIERLQIQNAWNDKQAFIDSLIRAEMDFDSEYLVLFRQTETSGSNQLTIKNPYLENSILVVEIERYVPGIGTDDMAYYCFAYRVKNEYKIIKFKIEKMDNVLIEMP